MKFTVVNETGAVTGTAQFFGACRRRPCALLTGMTSFVPEEHSGLPVQRPPAATPSSWARPRPTRTAICCPPCSRFRPASAALFHALGHGPGHRIQHQHGHRHRRVADGRLLPASGTAGAAFTVLGAGFQPNEAVAVSAFAGTLCDTNADELHDSVHGHGALQCGPWTRGDNAGRANGRRHGGNLVHRHGAASGVAAGRADADGALLRRHGDGPRRPIFAVGGQNGTETLDTLEIYDPVANTWTAGAPLPEPRTWPGVTFGHDGRLYVIGGVRRFQCARSSIAEAYSPETNTWTLLPAMPTPRYGLEAVTAPDGSIYAISGYANGDPLRTVEVFNPQTNTWHQVASTNDYHHEGAAATAPDGTIYVLGGYAQEYGSVVSGVEKYDAANDQWDSVASLITGRIWAAAAVGGDGQFSRWAATTPTGTPRPA